MDNLGYTEGEICNRNGCQGIIEEEEKRGCSCHINPPCPACTESRAYCPECEWNEREEEIKEEMSKPKETFESVVRRDILTKRELDSTKIDYYSRGSGYSSMIKEGVYPEGTTQEEVRKEVNGSFGGKFVHFGNGKFKFIAYTD
jgi:hypothetical protein